MDKHRVQAYDYFHVLELVHEALLPRAYIEIGVATGKSLSLALPGTVILGVDPAANLRHPVSGELHLFRQTSDSFFETGTAKAVLQERTIDMSFIDGLHHSDAVIRDFRNLEAISNKDGVVLIHDCIPPSSLAAQRERATKIWVGDVWKAILALRGSRPELTITVIDAPPTGIALITGLKPGSRKLFDGYEAIVAQMHKIAAPERDADWNKLMQAVPFDWPSIRAQLRERPFRDASLRALRRERSRRRPTLEHLKWQVRRHARASPLGRFLRQPSDLAVWSEREP